MKSFLAQPDAALFHITTRNKWKFIQQKDALLGDSEGRIFVSRSDDEAVLCSIALTQLVGLEEDVDLVVLQLPQALNTFEPAEFSHDTQATEIAMPFQSILFRAEVPLNHLILHREIRTTVTELGRISHGLLRGLPDGELYQKALSIIYEPDNEAPYRITAHNEAGIWEFNQQPL